MQPLLRPYERVIQEDDSVKSGHACSFYPTNLILGWYKALPTPLHMHLRVLIFINCSHKHAYLILCRSAEGMIAQGRPEWTSSWELRRRLLWWL